MRPTFKTVHRLRVSSATLCSVYPLGCLLLQFKTTGWYSRSGRSGKRATRVTRKARGDGEVRRAGLVRVGCRVTG